ncbi:hypothetical protein [Sediminicoccus rosea]|uniref:Uncharacterized protein n=1 Tax=Sediminicoccus rosea TaxID=1225128 RepID=A0ABZ0PHL9_9PROT|nr:hypothetical protein [Sediminicoccus rosea]WPB85229.1 hypothetical protein R9Z33_24465 [Sediminicoccus rosea]
MSATTEETAAHPWAGQERQKLQALMDIELVKLGIHIRKMNSPGSPVYRYAENIIPAGLILTSSFLATALIHFYVGAVVLAIGCWWWLAKVQPKIKEDVFMRTAAYVLQADLNFDVMWARGVLSLYAKLPDGTERVATRRDDWRAYVRSFHGLEGVNLPEQGPG